MTHTPGRSTRRRWWPTPTGARTAWSLRASIARRSIACALGGALLLTQATARSDIYTYTSADGTVHFTNMPGGDTRYRLYLRSRDGKRRAPGSVVAPSDTSVERFTRYDDTIREAATLYQIPEELVRAVIKVESDYDPRAVSRAGALGLMQLMPETAERMQVRDVMDPRENVLGGVRYLRVLANLFNGDIQLTLAGYNAGENAVVRFRGIPPYEETEDYVVRVLAYYRRYRESKDPKAATSSSAAE